MARRKSAPRIERTARISEIDRDIEPLRGRPELVDPEMQMWLALCVAGIAAGGDPLAACDVVSLLYRYAALLEVAVKRHGPVAVLDKDVVVLTGLTLGAGIRQVVPHPADDTAPGGRHIAAYRHLEIIRELVSMPTVWVAV
jgi:hypothetical protein